MSIPALNTFETLNARQPHSCAATSPHWRPDMETIEVSIKETSPNVWRLTFNGYPLGDSRGYSKAQATAEAIVMNGKRSGRWHGNQWIETIYRTKDYIR